MLWWALSSMCSFCCSLYYYHDFMRNQEGKIELQIKIHRRICARDITFLTACSPVCIFVAFFVYSFPLSSAALAEWPL